MSKTVRIGTRGSQLALWQANEVSKRLSAAGYEPEVVIIQTTGDRRHGVSLASIGGKGLFVKELEEALSRGEIDLAVHSLKDVPSIEPEGFSLSGFLERGDPRDAWIQLDSRPIADLPAGAKIGTSAPRRRAQLQERFPRLVLQDIRGNVDTRMQKLRAGSYDALVLASAGLTRLGRESEITSYFSVDDMVPAAGQGIIAMETFTDEARRIAQSMNHEPTGRAARSERSVLQKFGHSLDCYSAVGVHAEIGRQVTVRAYFGDGGTGIRVTKSGPNADEVVQTVYDELIAKGAR